MPRMDPSELSAAPAMTPAAAPAASKPAEMPQYQPQAIPEIPAPQGGGLNTKEMLKDVEGNPYKKWIYLAAAVDSWRIWPRMFLTVYVILVYRVVDWFMTLPAPSMEQSGLLSIIVGAGAAWFGLYLGSSPRK